jgi:antitoxin component YwqK of YwqJK toxin-antitoxin module
MDALHGEAKFYDKAGTLVAEGVYRNDKKHGIWKYYEGGELKEEKDFTVRSKNPYKKKK